MIRPMSVGSFEQFLCEILRRESIDAAVALGRCTARCSVSVDPIVDGRTTIHHNGDVFTITLPHDGVEKCEQRQREIIGPYVRWASGFHPSPEAWMT